MTKFEKKILILGASASGLALAYQLIKNNSLIQPIIIEESSSVGTINKTIYENDLGIEIFPQNSFKEDKNLNSILKNLIETDFIKNSSKTALLSDFSIFEGINSTQLKFFKQFDLKTVLCLIFSYLKSRIIKLEENNLKNRLINKFGKFAFEKFLKNYIKKVFGVSSSELPPETLNMELEGYNIFKLFFDKKLYLETYYPKFGYSQVWNYLAEYIINNGGKILLNTKFEGFRFAQNKIISAILSSNDEKIEISADFFVSTIALSELIKAVDVPFNVKQNALNLSYRDLISIGILTDKLNNINEFSSVIIDDTNTVCSKINILNNFSKYIVGDSDKQYLITLNYYSQKNDWLWNLKNSEIIQLAKKECLKYGLFDDENILDLKIIRTPNAIPSYFGTYKKIKLIYMALKEYKNLYLLGQNGTHQRKTINSFMNDGIELAKNLTKLGDKHG